VTLNPDDLVGRQVGPYTLGPLLGQGGFAWVYAGTRADGTEAAVKVLKPRYAGDPQFESRFRNEFKTAAALVHPHIVHIHEVGKERELTYFGMDRYPDSLGAVIEREGPLAEDRLLMIARDVADALAFAHQADIVHRDLKADNVFLAEDGRAVLADFGIARAVSGYATATGVNMTIGTPGYVSPEQAQGRSLDGRSDLYALGVLLYKGATGQIPFRSSDWFELARMHVEEAPEAPSAKRPGLSPRLERIILRLLAKHPDDRYPSAAALREEIDDLVSGAMTTREMAIPQAGLHIAEQPASPRGVPGWVVWGAGTLVFLGVVIGIVVLAR
jgi:serine/threonine-protein kinase